MASPLRNVLVDRVKLGSCTTTLRSVRGGPISIIFVHGLTATSYFFEHLMQRLPERFSAFALDLRGHGDSESGDYDATMGLRTFAEDIYSLTQFIGISQAHLVGWSLGGGVALQFAISNPSHVLSLTLEAPISPFGLHGTKDAVGTPCWEDYAGSGAGTLFPELLENIRKGDNSERNPFSLANIWSRVLFKSTFQLDPEVGKQFYKEGLKAKIGPGFIPGSTRPSGNWPGYRPGEIGIMNAASPLYCNLTPFITIPKKPPVLWIRGDSDLMIGDNVRGTPASLGRKGHIADWPGETVFPDQPMLTQTREMLENYRGKGGKYREIVFEDCGHTPHVEKETRFISELVSFIDFAQNSAFHPSRL